MKHFRKIWDAEKNEFLKSTKGMTRERALQLFREKWPNADVTAVAFYNQRSRMGAAGKAGYLGTRKAKPLYAEQIKKGYIRIKIAQPSVWVSKAKWVYMETHPWEDFSERSNYIFLDGNTRNFARENIERVPVKLMGIFANMGGTVPGAPECTRLNLLRAKLKVAQLDALEKHGTVVKYGTSRVDRKTVAAKRRKYYAENREKCAAYAREYNHKKGGTK